MRILLALIILSLVILPLDYAKAQEVPTSTHQASGTVISFTQTHIQIAYTEAGSKHTATFKVDAETKIAGIVRNGALVIVTYVVKRLHKGIFGRTALEIRVIEEQNSSDNSSAYE